MVRPHSRPAPPDVILTASPRSRHYRGGCGANGTGAGVRQPPSGWRGNQKGCCGNTPGARNRSVGMKNADKFRKNQNLLGPQSDGRKKNGSTRGYLAGLNNLIKKSAGGRAEGKEWRTRTSRGHEGLCCQGLAASPQRHGNRNDKMESVFIYYEAKMAL